MCRRKYGQGGGTSTPEPDSPRAGGPLYKDGAPKASDPRENFNFMSTEIRHEVCPNRPEVPIRSRKRRAQRKRQPRPEPCPPQRSPEETRKLLMRLGALPVEPLNWLEMMKLEKVSRAFVCCSFDIPDISGVFKLRARLS